MAAKTDPERIVKKYSSGLEKICGNNLRAIIVTGSISKKDSIPGWSDIDLVVVLSDMLPDQLIRIGGLGKVGVTVVKEKDLLAKRVPPKVKYGLSLNDYKIIRSAIKLPKIRTAEISGDFKTLLTLYYDSLIKCATRGLTPETAKKAVKFAFIMLKVIGREHGVNLKSYAECVSFARKIGLGWENFKRLDEARRRWKDIGDFKPIAVEAISAGNELFAYGRKLS